LFISDAIIEIISDEDTWPHMQAASETPIMAAPEPDTDPNRQTNNVSPDEDTSPRIVNSGKSAEENVPDAQDPLQQNESKTPPADLDMIPDEEVVLVQAGKPSQKE